MSAAAAYVGIAVVGAYLTSREQERQGAIDASLLNAQASNERRLAVLDELRGQEEERRLRSIGARRQGAQVNTITASGVALEGSPLDVLVDQAVQDDLEARTALFTAEQSAEARRISAQFLDIQAQQASKAGKVNAFNTILGTGLGIARVFT